MAGMAHEVDLGQAVPNTNATTPVFIDNTALLPITNTPPATGTIVVPNSPKGSSDTAHNFTNGFNYTHTITSTQDYVSSMIGAQNDGVAFNYNQGTPPAPPGKNVSQTIPNAPTGSFVMQGNNVTSGIQTFSGQAWAQGNVFRFQ